jgi:mRNA-binding protein PUF3
MNRNERGSAAQPGSIGQGFGGGKASWNSNIWGSSGFPSHFRDSATEKGNSQGELAEVNLITGSSGAVGS